MGKVKGIYVSEKKILRIRKTKYKAEYLLNVIESNGNIVSIETTKSQKDALDISTFPLEKIGQIRMKLLMNGYTVDIKTVKTEEEMEFDLGIDVEALEKELEEQKELKEQGEGNEV